MFAAHVALTTMAPGRVFGNQEQRMTINSVVIVGGGHGGFQTAASLRQDGFVGHITLINDEPCVPYQRPPLSKTYMTGKLEREALNFRPERFFIDNKIELAFGQAVAIDRTNRRVVLDSGKSFSYDHLVLATGAHNRPLSVPGAELDGVFGLRNRADAESIIARLSDAKKVIVVGAGFIGLEFAAITRALGASVDVLELAERPMARATSHETSAFFRAAHEAWGTKLHFGQGLSSIGSENGRVTAVRTTNGQRLTADLVVFGIGVLPNVALAAEAGLDIENGIKVDAYLLSSDPRISAIGDVAFFPSQHSAGFTRLESVQNAVDHARAVAGRLTGKAAPYAQVPWFWSDQSDLKLQIAGLATGHDTTVVLGRPEERQFSVLCFRHNHLVCVESINCPAAHMAARKLLGRSSSLSVKEASSLGFDLKTWEVASR